MSGSSPVSAEVTAGDRPVFIALTPCRLVDTRPAPNTVQLRAGPLGTGSTTTISAHGDNGRCVGASTIPSNALSLSLNVTAVRPTQQTFLTFWADGPNPGTSNLNPAPGQPPTPNAVNTPLSAAGTFEVFNNAGEVDLVIDVNGYYAHHNHDDRYPLLGDVSTKTEADDRYPSKADVYTKADADARYAAEAEVYTKDDVDDQFAPKAHSHPDYAEGSTVLQLVEDASPHVVDTPATSCTATGTLSSGDFAPCSSSLQVLEAPPHNVIFTVDTGWSTEGTLNSSGACQIFDGSQPIPGAIMMMGETFDTTDAPDFLARASMTFRYSPPVPVGPVIGLSPYQVFCKEISGNMDWTDMRLTAVVIPSPGSPVVI